MPGTGSTAFTEARLGDRCSRAGPRSILKWLAFRPASAAHEDESRPGNRIALRDGMKDRPLIGVPTQTLQAIDGIPPELPHSWVMNHRYFAALASVGAAPVMIPLLVHDLDALRGIYDALDGVFLAGGRLRMDGDLLPLDPAAARLYGFHLTRAGDELRTEYGLFTRVSATIPVRRAGRKSRRARCLQRS